MNADTHHMSPHGIPSEDASTDGGELFVWKLASELTSGLLANANRGHFTVKDTISLFDEVLHEMQNYTRIRGLPGASQPEPHAPSAVPAQPDPRHARPLQQPAPQQPAPLPQVSAEYMPQLPFIPPNAFGAPGEEGPDGMHGLRAS